MSVFEWKAIAVISISVCVVMFLLICYLENKYVKLSEKLDDFGWKEYDLKTELQLARIRLEKKRKEYNELLSGLSKEVDKIIKD